MNILYPATTNNTRERSGMEAKDAHGREVSVGDDVIVVSGESTSGMRGKVLEINLEGVQVRLDADLVMPYAPYALAVSEPPTERSTE